MRFFRIALYLSAMCLLIYSWDNFGRSYFQRFTCEAFQTSDVSEKNAKKAEPEEQIKEPAKLEISREVSSDLGITFEKGFENVAKKAMNSVVNVATMQLIENNERDGFPDIFRGGPFDDLLKDFFDVPQKKQKLRKANALGSGFIIRVDKKENKAYIVTNNHVVDKAKKIVISLSDKTELPAEIHAVDSRTDIAVLSVDLKGIDFDINRLKPMEWGDSDKLHEGNFVVAIGNPFGLGSTVTHGIVSAMGRNLAMGKASLSIVDDFIQHSAPINMGNSGGCLLNVYGKVIGINNAIFSTSGGNIGIGFAIPSKIAKITVDQLIKHKRTFRGWLGAEVHPVNAKLAESIGFAEKTLDPTKVFGAYISKIVPGGPAEKSDLKVGDIVIEFNGKQINEKCSLQAAVGTSEIGSSVEVKVLRQGNDSKWKTVTFKVKVGDFEKAMNDGSLDSKAGEAGSSANQKEKEADIDALGITISTIPDQYKSEYPNSVKVIVSKVDEDKGSSFFGPIFMPGDGFISANNKKITSVSQLKNIILDIVKDKNNRNKQIPFVIIRNGSQMMIATTLDFPDETESQKKDR